MSLNLIRYSKDFNVDGVKTGRMMGKGVMLQVWAGKQTGWILSDTNSVVVV